MSMSQDQFFETALSLPQSQRAELAFQLLQSLDPPGDVVDAETFGAELRARVQAHRRGEVESRDRDETRVLIQQRLSEGRSS
jgi:hypothetical protein